MGKAITIQEHFVYVADDGSETGSTLGTTDTNWTQNTDTVFRARFCITETDGGTENQAFLLRYNHNGGGYADVGAATPIKYAASAEDGWTITDGQTTTDRLSGTGTFTAGEYSEDGNTGAVSLTSQYTNLEFCLTIDSAQVADEDTILLQVWFSVGPTALDSYGTATPTITVNKPVADPAPNITDNAEISDSVTLSVSAPQISITDNAEISDSATASVEAGEVTPSITDNATISDSVTVSIQTPDPLSVNVQDDVTALDYLWFYESGILASESVTVEPEVTFPQPSVQDDATIGDAVTVSVSAPQVDITDNAEISDAASISFESYIAIQDNATIADSATANDRPPWYNTDTLVINTGSVRNNAIEDTWTDNGTRLELAEQTGIPGFDYEFWFQDVPATAESVEFNGYYSGIIGHQKKIQQWNYTTEGWTNLTSDLDDFPTAAADYTTDFRIFNDGDYNNGGEIRLKIVHAGGGLNTHSLYIDQLILSTYPAVHINEDVLITDSSTVAISTAEVSITDDATITDSVTVSLGAAGETTVTVQDNATIAESVTAEVSAPQITAQENATITDSATVSIAAAGETNVSAQDDATISESVSAVVSDPTVSIQDDATISESVSVSISGAGVLTISVQDDATVSDSVTIAVSNPQIVAQDDATITDSVSVSVVAAGAVQVSVQDDVTLTDTISILSADLEVTITENATISESVTVSRAEADSVIISVQDDLTLTDTLTVDPLIIDLWYQDAATIDESVTAAIPGYIVLGDPDRVAYVLFRDRRAYAEYKERRSYVLYKDKRTVV